MKTTLLLIALAMSAVGAVRASEMTLVDRTLNTKPNPFNYTLDLTLLSPYYLGTIVGGDFNRSEEQKKNGTSVPMSFTTLTGRRMDKDERGSVYYGVSVGQELSSKFNENGGTEEDLFAGRAFTLGTDDFPVLCDMNVYYLATYDLRKAKGDVISTAFSASLPEMKFFQPYFTFTRFTKVGDVAGSGWFLYAGVRKSGRIGTVNDEPLKAGFEYRAGFSGPNLFGQSSGLAYHRFSFWLSAMIGDGWSFTPTLVFQTSGRGQEPGLEFVPYRGLRPLYIVSLTRTL